MTLLLKRLAAASLAGGALAVSPIMLPAASAVDGAAAACPEYQAVVTSSTTLTLDPSEPEPGDTFTAMADVTVANDPATEGTVTFEFNGQSVDVPVSDGHAETEFTVPTSGGNFQVTASYSGVCVEGSGNTGVGGSSDQQGFVAGTEGTDDGGDTNGGSTGGTSTGGTTGTTGTTSGSNRAGTSAGVNGVTGDTGSSTGSLGGTGVDTQTELYALIGLGLVAVGGMSLMVHRRRVQA